MRTTFTPAMWLNMIAARKFEVPTPPTEKLSSPGLDFASAMSCFADFTGIDGWTTSTLGALSSSVIGAKSLIGSYDVFSMSGPIQCALPVTRSVWPSGGALATMSAMRIVGRLSTMSCWPSGAASARAIRRAGKSFPPPAGEVMMRIGLVG
jgi:hypothetical protein